MDPRVVPAGKMLRASNVAFVDGKWVARPGYERLGLSGPAAVLVDARAIASTGVELVGVLDTTIRAYSSEQDMWSRARDGAISPWSTTVTRKLGDEVSYPMSDHDEITTTSVGGVTSRWRMVAHQQEEISGISTITYREGVTIRTERGDGSPQSDYTDFYLAATTAAHGYAPRVLHCGTYLITIFPVYDVASTNATLYAVDAEMSAGPETLTDRGALHVAGGCSRDVTAPFHARMFDAVGGSASYWLVRLTPGATFVLERRDQAHAVQATVTVGTDGPYRRVSICTDGETPTRVTVFAEGVDGAGNPVLVVYDYNPTTLVLSWRTVILNVGVGGTDTYENLGCVWGTYAGSTRVVCTWGHYDTVSFSLEWRTLSTAGAGIDTLARAWCQMPWSRPWITDSRCYVVTAYDSRVTTAGATDTAVAAMTAYQVAELNGTVGAGRTTRAAQLVGVHHCGYAATMMRAGWESPWYGGSAPANVVRVGSGQHELVRYVVPVRTASTFGVPSTTPSWHRWGCDLVQQQHGSAVGAVSVWPGTLLIGGGCVSWYDGTRTAEIGKPVGVFASAVAATVLGGKLAGIATSVIGTWEARDARGILHRGPAGPPWPNVTPGGANNALTVTRYHLGLTNWSEYSDPQGRLGVVIYRSTAGGAYVRGTSVSDVAVNVRAGGGASFLTQTEGGAFSGEQLYVLTRDLEAVCPEPARYPAIVSQRVWLAGCSVEGEAWHSKFLYQSGTTRIAPEFNPVSTVNTPLSEPVVAVAELDGRIVILTETRTYVLSGQGPDDTGSGSDYGPLQLVSADHGCTDARSVVVTPIGVIWRASQELVLLDRSLAIQRIGSSVRDLTDAYPNVTSAVYVPRDSTVRFTIDDGADTRAGVTGLILVLDIDTGAWSPWYFPSVATGNNIPFAGGCLHDGYHHVLDATTGYVYREAPGEHDTWSGTDQWIPITLETSWVQSTGALGWQRTLAWYVQMERLNAHALSFSTYADFNASATQTLSFTSATIATFPELPNEMVRVDVRRFDNQAAKLKIQITEPTAWTKTYGQSVAITAISCEVAPEQGPTRVATVART